MKDKSYSHLTQVERSQIEEALSRGFSHRQIAKMLGRSHTTIGREVRRNRDEHGRYRCCVAHSKSRVRRSDASSKPWKVTEAHIENIYKRVCEGESPDSIAHPDNKKLALSTPWVYELIDRRIKNGDEDFDKQLLLRKYKRRRGRSRKVAGVAPYKECQNFRVWWFPLPLGGGENLLYKIPCSCLRHVSSRGVEAFSEIDRKFSFRLRPALQLASPSGRSLPQR